MIDAHHHLWDLSAVHYPWLAAKGATRFFGDPTPIQRNYLLSEFCKDAAPHGISGSVHIQVGAQDALAEATWVQGVSDAAADWPMAQVVFCDLTAPDLARQLDQFQALSTVRGCARSWGARRAKMPGPGPMPSWMIRHFLRGCAKLVRGGCPLICS
jgi:predicted TIM-barrel fold metal-dependent hydrolase